MHVNYANVFDVSINSWSLRLGASMNQRIKQVKPMHNTKLSKLESHIGYYYLTVEVERLSCCRAHSVCVAFVSLTA